MPIDHTPGHVLSAHVHNYFAYVGKGHQQVSAARSIATDAAQCAGYVLYRALSPFGVE